VYYGEGGVCSRDVFYFSANTNFLASTHHAERPLQRHPLKPCWAWTQRHLQSGTCRGHTHT